MKHWIFILSIFVLYSCNDKKSTAETENTTSTDAITETTTSTEDVEFPQKLSNGTILFHAIIGIKDTIGGPRVKYKMDMINYNLNKKFAFVDKNSEVFVTDQPDTVDIKNLHQYAKYIMKMHVYSDSVSDNGYNFQVINVGFNYNEATSTSRGKAATRPDLSLWTNRNSISTKNLSSCKKNDKLECQAEQLVANVAKLAFM
jgi:hypothetical protein